MKKKKNGTLSKWRTLSKLKHSSANACGNGKIEVAECLMKHGAQMNVQDSVSDEWQ